jgi:hypothetical protein
METVGKWWNGTWGRLARRDVFLRVGTLWEVEAREGGADGRSRIWRFLSEEEARAFAERCMTRPGKWRDLQHVDPFDEPERTEDA